jgi:hypothetical protein
MKRKLYILVAAIALGSLFSCEPVEDRDSLPAITYTEATLNHTEVVTGNTLNMTNNDKDVNPYWSITDATGAEIGHFNSNSSSVIIPFKGTYTVSYTAYTRGGALYTQPKTITIVKTDLSSITTDPRWAMLTNGAAGKTWVLNMEKPLEFIGKPTNYVNLAVSGGGWYPNLSDISWAGLENKDWGEVTFNLNEGYNVSVTQTSSAIGSTAKTTKTGTFTFTLTDGSTDDKIFFNGGTEMLHPSEANYFSSSYSFTNIKIVELTETSLCFIAIRADNDWLIYHLIPKPN